jgi:UDP-glucose 4-epimerase
VHVLVVGGAGYVGGVTTEALAAAGHQVTVFDDLSAGHTAAIAPGAQLVRGSILNPGDLGAVFAAGQYDAVMHFAAKIIVPHSMEDPGAYFENNISGVIALVNAMLGHGVSRLVFSSTATVYGEPDETPITEAAPIRPNNPYGESKATVERLLPWYASQRGLRYAAPRYFNAAGATERVGEWHQPETHLIPLALQSALGTRGPLTLYGDDYPTPDGTCVRDYVHVLDLAGAHLKALAYLTPENAPSLVCNLGSGSGYSNRQVLDAIAAVTGKRVPIVMGERRPGDAPITVASNTKAAAELGWRPQLGLTEIVESAWRWLCAHPHGYQEQP